MRFMSAREAAEKWDVSLRRVQLLLHDGRIAGAEKHSAVWLIPADAEKPADARRERGQKSFFYTLTSKCPLLTMTTLYTVPGSGDDVTLALEYDPCAQALFSAQLAYLRGRMQEALEQLDKLPALDARPDARMGADVLRCLCAVHLGDVKGWLRAKHDLAHGVSKFPEDAVQRAFQLGHISLGLYDQSGFPDWFCRGDFEPLPLDSFPFARYAYMKYLMLARHDPAVSLIAMPLVAQSHAEGALVSEIYCRLMLAVGFHEQGLLASAAEQLDRALALALPDGLLAPLAEYRNDLGLLLDERMALVNEGAARKMRALNRRLTEGWTALNRDIRGVINTAGLTPQEHHAAKLAARGLSNAEIAKRMRLAVNTVKRHISEAMGKTGATSRNDLARFIAMDFSDDQN